VNCTVLACSIASLGCSLVFFLCCVLFPRVRRTPGWILVRSAGCEAFFSLGLIALFFVERSRVDDRDSLLEKLLVYFIVFWELASTLWSVIMYLHLMTIYRNPFKPGRHRTLYMPAVFIIATIALVVLVKTNSDPLRLSYYGLLIVPFASLVIFGGVLQTVVWWLLHKARKEQRTGNQACISFLAQQRVMKHSVAYLLLHSLMLGLSMVLAILLHVGIINTYWEEFWTQIVAALVCGRPVVSILGWCVINDVVYILCGKCSFSCLGIGAPRTTRSGTSEIASAGVVHGVREERRRSVGEDFRAALPASWVGQMEQRERITYGMQTTFKEELRFELLYDVARSIGDLAFSELLESHPREPRPSLAAALNLMSTSREGSTIDLTHGQPNHALHAHESHQLRPAKLRRTASDGDEAAEHQTGSALSRSAVTASFAEPARCNHAGFEARNYAVTSFREIRSIFGISTSEYARAFPNDVSEHEPHWHQKFKESISEGASGSFFYRVMGNTATGRLSRFIVKQVTKAEKRTFMKLLPAYHDYVQRRNGRSCIQYFGCHSMSLRWQFSGKVYFVVMRNFLPVQNWLTFDLKGATANRRALSQRSFEVRTTQSYGTLRDWEWMDIAMVADLPAAHARELEEILASDAAFLASQGCLDYSLLVGIHRVSADMSVQEREERLSLLTQAGGYVSLDQQKVYFFGIIDILETWDLRWKAQHALLKTGYHMACKGRAADGISALPPKEYADRFRTFISREVIDMPEDGLDRPTRTYSWLQWQCSDDCPSFCCPFAKTLHGAERWERLWARRRHGLAVERIQTDHVDHRRRIAELERELLKARSTTSVSDVHRLTADLERRLTDAA